MQKEQSQNKVYLGYNSKAEYPSELNNYSPEKYYSEYPFEKENFSEKNDIYELIRNGFHSLEYDLQNYGTKNWNPLGKFIEKGNIVLLKPNWVMHYNKNKKNPKNLECLVTHPSIVRAIIDYTIIALNGTGKIVIADAPMQGCDLNELLTKAGYDKLFDFYKERGIELHLVDLRQLRVVTNTKIITETIKINDETCAETIDISNKSAHKLNIGQKYKVSDYLAERTNAYHSGSSHIYKINKHVLDADVIINLPKPKCHRLSGITAAQKNMVGIIYDKASLPHRTIGAKEKGGDEYPKRNKLKSLFALLEEKKLRFTEKGKVLPAILFQIPIGLIYLFIKIFKNDNVMIGSWYGNDTIWRTVVDLNYIIRYCDKNGVIKNSKQRRLLNIADMIIAGQGNGPIGPYPKNLGMILIGEDSVFVDALFTKIAGFDIAKIPGLIKTMSNSELICHGEKTILSNIYKFNKTTLDSFVPNSDWQFEPHEFWKGFIENSTAQI